MQRLSRGAVPRYYCLALVRDPHGRGLYCGLFKRVARRGERPLPDLLSIVLHPTGLREMLGEFLISPTEHCSVLRHDKARGSRSALIDREN